MRAPCVFDPPEATERGARGFEARVRAGAYVESEPLRRAFETVQREQGVTPNQIAERVGWVKPDGQRVRRSLGLKIEGRGHQGKYLSYENALALARAMGVDPVEVGL